MGNSDTKISYRKSVIRLTSLNEKIDTSDKNFWSQFYSEQITSIHDIFTLIPGSEIRALREKAPKNLAHLIIKCIQRLDECVENLCITSKDQCEALNCVRLLTRLLPYLFESELEWRDFFWKTNMPQDESDESEAICLAQSLLTSLSSLLFIPDFTATSCKKPNLPTDTPDDARTLDSCEYIWESGVGYPLSPPHMPQHDYNRVEILKLCLVCFSQALYVDVHSSKWISFFTSSNNRHVLPLFTSLVNIVFAYDPVGMGVPYNYMLLDDSREPLVACALQILCVTLELSMNSPQEDDDASLTHNIDFLQNNSNLFINYLSRIHIDEDFDFIIKGFCRLLNNPLQHTYFPGSMKKIAFHQELLILFWRFCDFNKKFLYSVLKSSQVLDILVPVLYYLADSRSDSSKIGLVHICVFILLLLSGERNFGVRLNKPYTSTITLPDIQISSGTHADLLILVFHKLMTNSNNRLHALFDCLLTIIANVSPYLKSLTMITSAKLLHLLEAFSAPSYLYANVNNHHLVFFMLEAFNNIIQYQFDGNSNLVYTIIRRRNIIYDLLNLPTDQETIDRLINCKIPKKIDQKSSEVVLGLRASLAATPSMFKMTENTTPTLNLDQSLTNQIFSDEHVPSTSDPNQSLEEATRVLSQLNVTTNKFTKIKSNRLSSSSGCLVKNDLPSEWRATSEWVMSWKQKLPMQTIIRMLQVLVPQVEKICLERGLTDESEIIKFLKNGTLVGLLPVPHPILIRKYQSNIGTTTWFKTYTWGVVYLRNVSPPIWYDTDIKLFEIQRV